MSDPYGDESVTEGWRAVDLFTNRESISRLFIGYLNDEPAPSQILFFHGTGGNGKSLLLDYFRERLCKRLDRDAWNYLQSRPEEDVVAQVAASESAQAVPVARLDFATDPISGYEALVKLRRDFGGTRLRFPLFDFAIVTHLHKTHRLNAHSIGTTFPSDEIDLINEMAGLVQEIPFGGLAIAALNLGDRRLGNWFRRYRQRRQVDRSSYEAIMRMDPEKELVRQLPRFFAEDLNNSMEDSEAPDRVALFFDTHEAFWGEDRALNDDQYFGRELWFRQFISLLDRSLGIVVVVAGRDVPRWHEAPSIGRLATSDVDLHLVGNLTDNDADLYLRKCLVQSPDVRHQLRENARVGADEIHPFALGLGADLARAAARNGEVLTEHDLRLSEDGRSHRRQLANRLLRYVDRHTNEAILALSVCRTFDRSIYQHLGQALEFPVGLAGFSILTSFSFIQPASTSEGSLKFRTHQLLRRLLDEEPDEIRHGADEAMEEFFRQRFGLGDYDAIVDAIHHANRREWNRGLTEWLERFDRAVEDGHFAHCRALLEIRSELKIENETRRGDVAASVGAFHALQAGYTEALAEFSAAVANFDAALARAPDDPEILTNKGNPLQLRGDLLVTLSEHAAAEESYTAALASYDAALIHAPDNPGLLSNKGNALQRRGALLEILSSHAAAAESYTAAVAAYDAALARAPDDPKVLNNRGTVLHRRGNLLAILSDHASAEASYTAAVAAFDAALACSPGYLSVLNNKGNSLHARGELFATLSDYAAAETSYTAALAAYDTALARAPDDPKVLNNRGIVLQCRGDLSATMTDYASAEASYTAALAAFDAALALAPDDPRTFTGKGHVLHSYGDLLVILSNHASAEASYTAALAAFDAALALAPDSLAALNGTGAVLNRRGTLQVILSNHAAAEANYTAALTAFDAALALAPGYLTALGNKGNALHRLGVLQTIMIDYAAAEASYTAALVAFDTALALAPDNPHVLNNKGFMLTSRAGLLATLSNHAAETCYTAALAAFESALALAPDSPVIIRNRTHAESRLKELRNP